MTTQTKRKRVSADDGVEATQYNDRPYANVYYGSIQKIDFAKRRLTVFRFYLTTEVEISFSPDQEATLRGACSSQGVVFAVDDTNHLTVVDVVTSNPRPDASTYL